MLFSTINSRMISLLPPNTARTVVIFESHVMTGLISFPSMLVASNAPQIVCPAGEQSMLWSQTAAWLLLTRNKGNTEQGVTMWVCLIFWKLISSIPQSEQQSIFYVLFLAGPVTDANMPQICLSTEFQVLAFSLFLCIFLQISTSKYGMNRFFHCSCALNHHPSSTVMFAFAPVEQQLTAFNLFLLSSHIAFIYTSVKPVYLGKSVQAHAKSYPQQGSSKQQQSLFQQVLSSTDHDRFLIFATALILPVVVLQNIFFAFFSISFHVMLSHFYLSKGSTSLCFSFHACETAKAAQNNSPLSSAGTLVIKSLVGTVQDPFWNTHGKYPPNPGYLWQNYSKVCVFFFNSSNTYAYVQISCLPVERMLANIPT